MTVKLALLARKMNLTPAQAIALPAVIMKAVCPQCQTESEVVAMCYRNSAVCEYLASVCRMVTK